MRARTPIVDALERLSRFEREMIPNFYSADIAAAAKWDTVGPLGSSFAKAGTRATTLALAPNPGIAR
jgi:hypothetical protein